MAGHLLDTNAALRAVHTGAAEHPTVVSAISSLVGRGEGIYLVSQVIVEFWSVASRPADVNGLGWDRAIVAAEVEGLLDRFPLLPETVGLFDRWLHLVRSREIRGRQVHDARLVAAMIEHGVTHLLTFNVDHFRRFPEITVVDPRDVE